VEYLIYIKRQETDVLVNNDKNTKIDKNKQISIDIFNVKIQGNILYKRVILLFERIII